MNTILKKLGGVTFKSNDTNIEDIVQKPKVYFLRTLLMKLYNFITNIFKERG